MNPRLAIYAVEDYIASTRLILNYIILKILRYLTISVIRNVVSVNEL